jgi:hypothetical protein
MEIGGHTFASGKTYAYVRAADGSITFLRNILFIVNAANPKQIALVHEWGAKAKASWEPPKGQMEWKEFASAGLKKGSKLTAAQLVKHQRAGMMRELTEEAKILPSEISDLRRLDFAYKQEWPESGLKNAHFMYQYWTAKTSPKILLEAQSRLDTLKANPDWKAMLPADNSEKDAIIWWSPDDGWDIIYGSFSKKMTQLYFKDL